VLRQYGYRVWMSHKGTIPLDSTCSALENCIRAVERADAVFGIINGRYGSGKTGDDLAITHREILRALELNKPRFFAVHRDVVIARQVLRQFRNEASGNPKHHSFFKPTAVLDDIRILDLYESATQSDVALANRTGNWVQQYSDAGELLLFLESQFSDIERLRTIIAAHAELAKKEPV